MYISAPLRSSAAYSPAVRFLRPSGTRAQRGFGQAASTSVLGSNPIGAAVGIASGLLQIGNMIDNLITSSGCGATCIQATNIVNQAGDLMTQNLQTYLAAPVHYQSAQTQALANFNSLWNALEAACSSPSLGTPGANCIAQREEGACSYKTTPGGWQQSNGTWTYVWPGANGSGSTCWNYFVGFYDPIANDPTVVPDPPAEALTSALSSLTGGASTIAGIPITDLLIGGGALLLALLLL